VVLVKNATEKNLRVPPNIQKYVPIFSAKMKSETFCVSHRYETMANANYGTGYLQMRELVILSAASWVSN
jgi:hypothetical protein